MKLFLSLARRIVNSFNITCKARYKTYKQQLADNIRVGLGQYLRNQRFSKCCKIVSENSQWLFIFGVEKEEK